MDTLQIVGLAIVGAIILLMWVVYVVDKNQTIRAYEQALETFADLCPELRNSFGEPMYIDKNRYGDISIKRVRKYIEAKKAVEVSQGQQELVLEVENRFKGK